MSDIERNPMEEEMDDLDNIIRLLDEDGNAVEFEFLDSVEYNGNDYAVLIPLDDNETGEVVIMRVETTDEGEAYIGIDDEEEAVAVFEIFRENAKAFFESLS